MEANKVYVLPDLPYGYNDLEPYFSEQQLRIHHDKHHLTYVNARTRLLRSSVLHERATQT